MVIKLIFSLIKESDRRCANSDIIIRCITCDHIWNSNVSNHIDKKRGCPSYAQNLRWTLNRLLPGEYE